MVLVQLDSHMKKNKAGPLFHNIYKINSKRIVDLNVGAKILKLLEESRDEFPR